MLPGFASRFMKRPDMTTAKGHTTSLFTISYFSCGLFYSYGFTSFPQYPNISASLHVRPGLSYKSQQSIRSVSARKTSIDERTRINPPWWKKSPPPALVKIRLATISKISNSKAMKLCRCHPHDMEPSRSTECANKCTLDRHSAVLFVNTNPF